jgi:hypothetical protein
MSDGLADMATEAGVARAHRRARRLARRPYYLLRPRLWHGSLGMLDTRTMVSHAGGFVYLRIPKAANSTVFRALIERHPEPGVETADIEAAKSQVTHFGDLGFRELRRLRRYFVFTVVRNPYARALSAYLDKFRPGEPQFDRFAARVAGFDGGDVSFAGFCRYLAAGGEAENAHWMRQTRITRLADRIDLVGRVESLDADLARIFARIGAGGGGPIVRAGPPPTGAAGRLGAHYDPESAALVSAVYREDFDAFGYATEDL